MLYTWYKNSKEFGGRIWNYIYSIYFCPYRNLILYMYIYIFLPIYGLGFHKLLFATSYMQTHAAIFYFLRPQSQTLLSFHNCFVIIEANSVYWPNLKQSVCYKINCLTSEIVNLFVPFKLNVLTNNLHSQICFILKFASCAFIFLKNWPLKKKNNGIFYSTLIILLLEFLSIKIPTFLCFVSTPLIFTPKNVKIVCQSLPVIFMLQKKYLNIL